MHTPSQVARAANVTPQSIRNWSREYASLLSPHAAGAGGQRLYTDEDMQVLCDVAALRKSGVPRDEVSERIRRGQAAPTVIDASPQTGLNEAQTTLNAPLAMQTAQSALQGHVEALARRVDALAAEQRAQMRDMVWWGRLQGAIAGLVLAGFLLWLSWLLAR